MNTTASKCFRQYFFLAFVVTWGFWAPSNGQLQSTISGDAAAPAPAASSGFGYVYAQGPATWAQAEADCVSRGGHLVSVESSADNPEVQALCTEPSGCWIGLHDQAAPGSESSAQQPCMVLFGDTPGWRNRPCSEEHAYICKVPLQETQPAAIAPTTAADSVPATAPVTAANATVDADNSSTNSTAVLAPINEAAASAAAISPMAEVSSVANKPHAATVSSAPASSPADSKSLSTSPGSDDEHSDSDTDDPQATVITQQVTAAAASLANDAQGGDKNANQPADTSPSSDEGMEPWKLALSIVIPVLAVLTALITMSYKGWKWWQRRRGLMAQRKFQISFMPSSGSLASQSSGRLIRAHY